MEKLERFLLRARCAATSRESVLRSIAVTDPPGRTRWAMLIPGSPVPLARSRTCIPGRGAAYSTIASVTPLPITADWVFHFSGAIRRWEEPQDGYGEGAACSGRDK